MGKRIYHIGIDPGTKTGFAIYDSEKKKLITVCSCGILDAIKYVECFWQRESMHVRVEDARLRKWFGANSNLKQQGAGSIKRDCSIWEEFFDSHKDIKYEFVSPGRSKTKLTADEFKKLTGWTLQTNEHARDAAMLVMASKTRII
jgi:hypothetical protein